MSSKLTEDHEMTQDLDALPLPAPTHFRNGVLYAFSADQIRADRIKVWELAMRKAQEGREPVGVVYTMQALSSLEFDGGPPKCHVSLYEDLPAGTKLYAPPPKSDEAMDALIKAARWFADNPDSPKSALGHITEALAALAAQQKGGEA